VNRRDRAVQRQADATSHRRFERAFRRSVTPAVERPVRPDRRLEVVAELDPTDDPDMRLEGDMNLIDVAEDVIHMQPMPYPGG
jgi:hypothetical protein